jgi:hypothetical protein
MDITTREARSETPTTDDDGTLVCAIAESIKRADEHDLYRLLSANGTKYGDDDTMSRFANKVKLCLRRDHGILDITGVEDYNGDTCLHYAARSGHSLVLRFFYNAGLTKEIDQYVNRQGDTPLHDAVRKGHVVMTKQLIFLGCDPKRPNRMSETPNSIARKSHNPALQSALKKLS